MQRCKVFDINTYADKTHAMKNTPHKELTTNHKRSKLSDISTEIMKKKKRQLKSSRVSSWPKMINHHTDII